MKIPYPPSMDTDELKLMAVYSMLDQARMAHNYQGEIAAQNWKRLKRKWAGYSRKYHKDIQGILDEKYRLSLEVRRAFMSDQEWSGLNDQDRLSFFLAHLKPKPEKSILIEYPALERIKRADVNKVEGVSVIDPYEDWTTYTESDPDSHITVTDANTVDAVQDTNDTGYVRKDFGGDYFVDFVHSTKMTFTSFSPVGDFGYSSTIHWALTHGGAAYTRGLMSSLDDGVCVYFYAQASPALKVIAIFELQSNNNNFDSYTISSIPVTYYPVVSRSGTSHTCDIYSNANRTTLVDTLSFTGSSVKYQYLYCCMARGDAGSSNGSLTTIVEDTDISWSPTHPYCQAIYLD